MSSAARTSQVANILDTHAHLTSEQFANDMSAVLARAVSVGVTRVIAVSESIPDAYNVLRLSEAHEGVVFPGLGLHPEHVSVMSDSEADATMAELSDLLRQSFPHVVAIGEVGLDHSPRVITSGSGDVAGRQLRVFRACIRLARELGLPLSVHSRGAGRHAVQVLEEESACDISVLHAFDGRAVYAERAAKSGCCLSVPPSIVRSPQMQKMVKRVPLENLLVETDSPVLGVEATERNEPAMAVRAVEMIAGLKGLNADSVRLSLAQTAQRIFPRVFNQRDQ